jgi:hypothetical protein
MNSDDLFVKIDLFIYEQLLKLMKPLEMGESTSNSKPQNNILQRNSNNSFF